MDKILSIELPTAEPITFAERFENNFKYLKLLKDIAVININFQRYTDDEIDEYVSKIKSMGFEVYWKKGEYSGENGVLKIREETHQLYPHCKYNMVVDDDITITENTYIWNILLCIKKMEEDDKIGLIVLTKPSPNFRCIIYPELRFADNWLCGGHIVRNRPDKHLFDEKYHNVKGGGEDQLRCYQKILEGYQKWGCATRGYIHDDPFDQLNMGGVMHGWDKIKELRELDASIEKEAMVMTKTWFDNPSDIVIIK